jgi:hypothetical protein
MAIIFGVAIPKNLEGVRLTTFHDLSDEEDTTVVFRIAVTKYFESTRLSFLYYLTHEVNVRVIFT